MTVGHGMEIFRVGEFYTCSGSQQPPHSRVRHIAAWPGVLTPAVQRRRPSAPAVLLRSAGVPCSPVLSALAPRLACKLPAAGRSQKVDFFNHTNLYKNLIKI